MLVNIIRPIPPSALGFVGALEGDVLTGYLDSAGVPTIGRGHTGPGVFVGMTITPQQSDDFLRQDLATAAQRLEEAVGEACVTELTENQYTALLSFVFNVGCDPKWGICQRLRAQQFDQVPSEMVRFVNAGGRKLQGLVNRRAEEVKLWSTDEPGSVPDDPSSSFTRATPTPPTSPFVKSLGKSKSWFAGLITSGLAVANGVASQIHDGATAVSDALAPYVGQSVVLQHIQASLTVALAVSSVALVALLWLKNKEAQSQ